MYFTTLNAQLRANKVWCSDGKLVYEENDENSFVDVGLTRDGQVVIYSTSRQRGSVVRVKRHGKWVVLCGGDGSEWFVDHFDGTYYIFSDSHVGKSLCLYHLHSDHALVSAKMLEPVIAQPMLSFYKVKSTHSPSQFCSIESVHLSEKAEWVAYLGRYSKDGRQGIVIKDTKTGEGNDSFGLFLDYFVH